MALTFKKIRWRNFLATGDAWIEIDLNRSPNTLIIGENGSGKSTLADALCFALFSRPYRKINKPQLVNSVNGKHLLVEVEFVIGRRKYMIRRGIKPAIFEIYIDGQLVDQSAKARDYQEYLEKNILKLNYKSFTQIVILGSSNFIPFMQLSAANRREIIENLLDIRIFSVMNFLLKQRVADNKQDLQDINYQINLIEEKIALHDKFIEEQKKDNDAQIERNKAEIEKSRKEIKDRQITVGLLQEEATSLRESIKDSGEIATQESQLNIAGKSLDSKLKQVDTELGFFQTNTTCPTCDQDIGEDARQGAILSKMQKQGQLIDLRNQVDSSIKLVQARWAKIEKITSEIDYLNIMISGENSAITALNTYIEKVIADNQSLVESQNKQELDKSARSKLTADCRKFKKVKERLIDKRNLHTIANELLKDRGIKTIIIKQYIPIMNKLINNYLTAMEFFVDFELDENFNETILSRFRDDFSYSSFSEGEKQRIDLALLFTWRAIAKLKNSMSTNLLILDETFDSSLDTAGCEDFLKLIYDLGKGTNVYVISHKGDLLQDKFRSLIRFEKYKGFTRLVGDI